jgi:hypothetical protein
MDPELNDQSQSPAEALNTEAQGRIPYERFREVNERAKAAEAKLEALQSKQKDDEETRLAEANEYKALYEKAKLEIEALKPFKARTDELAAALKATVDAEMASLPEDVRSLVPEFDDPRKTLDWLNKNKGKLLRPLAPSTDAGRQGDRAETIQLTPNEEAVARAAGMTNAQYAEAKLKVAASQARGTARDK